MPALVGIDMNAPWSRLCLDDLGACVHSIKLDRVLYWVGVQRPVAVFLQADEVRPLAECLVQSLSAGLMATTVCDCVSGRPAKSCLNLPYKFSAVGFRRGFPGRISQNVVSWYDVRNQTNHPLRVANSTHFCRPAEQLCSAPSWPDVP